MKPAPVDKTIVVLKKEYPGLRYYLDVRTPLETLVGAILSPQVRDEVVNRALPTLFSEYKTAKDFADADLHRLQAIIKDITFSSNKANSIKRACQILVDDYDGEVPKTVMELTKLPGVGEKTAHAVLQNAYGIVEGVVVDTHVLRVAYRLGWTSSQKNADKTAQELARLLPKKEWKTFPWLMKRHGRAICKAPVPLCQACPVNIVCPKRGV